jgi:hypothetical protein
MEEIADDIMMISAGRNISPTNREYSTFELWGDHGKGFSRKAVEAALKELGLMSVRMYTTSCIVTLPMSCTLNTVVSRFTEVGFHLSHIRDITSSMRVEIEKDHVLGRLL